MRTRSKEQCSRPETDEDQFFPTWVEWDTAEQVITYEAEREWLQRARAKWKQG
jgi:hypothetical protein